VADLIRGESGARCGMWKTEEKCIKHGTNRSNPALWERISGNGAGGNGAEDRSRTDDLLITNQIMDVSHSAAFRCNHRTKSFIYIR
jgi:hypothetical protein